MANEKAKALAIQLIKELYDHAKANEKHYHNLAVMVNQGAARMRNLLEIADYVGYVLAIQPPEEPDTWYIPGYYREYVKRVVFHFWNRRDEELRATGRDHETDLVEVRCNLTEQLSASGITSKTFTNWLSRSRPTSPSIEAFLTVALFEGFGVKWSRKPSNV